MSNFKEAEEQYQLGEEYYKKGDYPEAVKWYRKSAEQGNADAQNSLGFCYDEGQGVTQDYSEAVKWYRKSAEQGNAKAQNNLGSCYYYGDGVTQEYSEAVKWYRKSAEQGHAAAQRNLALCYEEGKGVTQDYSEAVKWYRKSAEQGDVSAQRNLALCYEQGQGVTQDYSEAVKWYRKSAEQGDVFAQYTLGFYYDKGKGVTQDIAEAMKWYKKAADNGDQDAKDKVEEMTKQLSAKQINGHDYVDLGLPSGLKWATCNVGANKPEDYGKYYAWGETSTKSSYNSDNSKTYSEQMYDIKGNSQYNAARANWGGTWRLPTKAECQELVDRCTWNWTTQNGVKGYKVTGPNGNSIFLPATGYRFGSSLFDTGEIANYWSSTPIGGNSSHAYYLYFYGRYLFVNNYYRYYGQSVRPVSE